jgi:hypothetical protein
MLSIVKELMKATKARIRKQNIKQNTKRIILWITKRVTKWKETLKVDADALKVGEMYDAYYNQMYPELNKYNKALYKAYKVTEVEKDKAVTIYKNSKTETTKTVMYEKYYKSQDVIENGYIVDNLQEAQALSKKSYEAAKELSTNSPYNSWYLTTEELNILEKVLKEALVLSKKAYDAVEAVAMEKDSDKIVYKKEVYKEACFSAKKALDNARELTYEVHDKAWFDNKNGKTYRKRYWKTRADLWLSYSTLRVYLLFHGDE